MSSKLVCNKPGSSLLSQSSCKGLSTKFRQQPAKTLQILAKILLRIFVKPCHKDIQSFGKQEIGKMIYIKHSNLSLSFKHLSQYSKDKKSHIFGGIFVLGNGINFPFIFF